MEIVSRLYCGRGSAKTTAMTSSILSGEDIEVFENRYRKRWYAYNLWSARWDAKAKLMFVWPEMGKTFQQEEIMLKSDDLKLWFKRVMT
jgi:hypothetical protein